MVFGVSTVPIVPPSRRNLPPIWGARHGTPRSPLLPLSRLQEYLKPRRTLHSPIKGLPSRGRQVSSMDGNRGELRYFPQAFRFPLPFFRRPHTKNDQVFFWTPALSFGNSTPFSSPAPRRMDAASPYLFSPPKEHLTTGGSGGRE